MSASFFVPILEQNLEQSPYTYVYHLRECGFDPRCRHENAP